MTTRTPAAPVDSTDASERAPKPTFLARVARPELGILVLCLVLFLLMAGRLPLFDPDEPFYAEGGREMLRFHDWVTPHFNGFPHLNKPALFYWLAAISMRILGSTVFAARLPSALAALACVAGTMAFARRTLGAGAGRVAGLALGTCLNTVILAHAAVTDMTLTAFLTGAVLSFYEADAPANDRSRRRFLLAAYGCIAGALLTKGFIGILLPLLILFAYHVWRRDLSDWIHRSHLAIGLAGALALWAVWFVQAWRANGPELWRVMVLNEQFRRFHGGLAEHPGPWWYYLPVVIVLFFPWSALLPAAIGVAVRRARDDYNRGGPKATDYGRRIRSADTEGGRGGRSDGGTDSESTAAPLITRLRLPERSQEPVVFAGLWAGLVLMFFSVSRVKLHFYVASIYPPMAILVGGLWRPGILRATRRQPPVLWLPLAVLGAAVAAAAAATPSLVSHSSFARGVHLAPETALLAGLIAGITAVGAFTLLAGRMTMAVALLAAMAVAGDLIAVAGIAPALARGREAPLRALCMEARRLSAPGQAVASFDLGSNLPVFYSAPPVIEMDRIPTLQRALQAHRARSVLCRSRDVGRIMIMGNVAVVSTRGPWVLLAIRPDRGDGGPHAGNN